MVFVAIGTAGANQRQMEEIAPHSYFHLEGMDIEKLIKLVTFATQSSLGPGSPGIARYQQIRRVVEQYKGGFYA